MTLWPPDILRDDPEAVGLSRSHRLIAATPLKPSLVIIERALRRATCPRVPRLAAPPCIDRFVVDDVISFDDPYASASASPAASATPFPFDSPPPPPSSMANCSQSRAAIRP